jgi:DNA-binding CsgD family transcriptional regulator
MNEDASDQQNGSGLDFHIWADVLCALPAAPATEDSLVSWVDRSIPRLFAYDKFWAGYGRFSSGRIQILKLISSGQTEAFLASRDPDLRKRPCFAWWVLNRRPIILHASGALDETGNVVPTSEHERDDVKNFGLGVVAAHGVIDPLASSGTYLSFSGVDTTQLDRIFAALKLVAPIVHSLFLQTLPISESVNDCATLTDRQRELIELAISGLSDKAIATRLAISDHTVGNHFRAIYAKLRITKRSQLIALLK